MYRAYGLLLPDTDFTLSEAFKRLQARFPGYSVTMTDDQITVARGDWEIEMALVTGGHVLEETVGITDKLAGLEPAEADELVSSDRRVEVWSETPDPFMEHFNDYLYAVEVLKTFHGLVAVDPNEPSLL